MDYYGNNNDMGENRDQDPFAPGYYQPGPSNPGSCGEPGFTGFHDGPSGPEIPSVLPEKLHLGTMITFPFSISRFSIMR